MDVGTLYEAMIKKHPAHLVCKLETDIVIEGYPRSSNSFTVWMLNLLVGDRQALRIAHHTHSIDNLRLGVLLGKPIVVLLRRPEDAILSYMIYGDRTVEFATTRYIKFYSEVLELSVAPVVVEFETVTSDFNQVVPRINAATARRGTKPVPLSQDFAADSAKVKVIARKRADDVHGDKAAEQVSVPNELREKIKAERRAEVQAYLAARPEVMDLYNKVLAYGH